MLLAFIAVFVMFKGKADATKASGYFTSDFELPFSIIAPDMLYTLPTKLKEISGLALSDESQVYAINDEKGILYLFDFELGKIIAENKFGKHGDFEALAKVNDLIYIAESNGDIQIVNTSDNKKEDKIETPLSIRNDVEGLCYNSNLNQLLIACKGQPEKAKKHKGKKGIYSFNLSNQSFDKKPYLLIDLKNESKKLNPINIGNSLLQKWSFNSRIDKFAPSGLAIDPITNHLYVLANRGKILLIIDENKEILAFYFLDPKQHGQPEGIVFDRKGNLYISNEGRSGKANIFYFKRKRK